MGTWSWPDTPEKARAIVGLVSRPLSAAEAPGRLYSVMGTDTLFDMIAAAREGTGAPRADVRSLVALELEESVCWGNGGGSGETREILEEALSVCLSAGDPDRALACQTRFPADADARAAVMDVLGWGPDRAGEVAVRDGRVPGVKVVTLDDGRVYRFDSVWGVVIEADAERRAALSAEPEAARPSP